MKTTLLFLIALFFSFSIYAQIDFNPHIIVDSHADVSGPYTLMAADIDGDGDLDILATSTNGGKVVWFENLDGNGYFSEPKTISSDLYYPLDISLADIDGDGDLDVIAVSTYDNKIAWFENLDGAGNFGPIRLIPSSLDFILTVEVADIDGDGDIDIVVGGDNKIIWLENIDGLGTFGPEKIVTTSISSTESIVISDVDGDGDMDIVVADFLRDIVAWYENTDGQGTFGPEIVITDDADGTNAVITTDIDNDGDLDVVSISDSNYLAWFENQDGKGNFSAPKIIVQDPGFIFKLFAADLSGNGNEDIIASLYDKGEIIWVENEGSGNFGPPHLVYKGESGAKPIGVIAADFNGDGKMDVAAGIYGTNQIIWFENKGPLSVQENTTTLFSLYPNPVKNLLNIKCARPISAIAVYNNIGQLLLSSSEKNQMDVSSLRAGIYFVKITDGNGNTETKKIIKE